jgi:hypothetical protein
MSSPPVESGHAKADKIKQEAINTKETPKELRQELAFTIPTPSEIQKELCDRDK